MAGEWFAVWWLRERGFEIVGRNVELDGGEIDILALDGSLPVAVEVRTITGAGDPIDAIDHSKRRHVSRLAARAGAGRVDFVGLAFGDRAVEVHYVPG
ncbi:MAG: YraN family protein [Acidimicrobiia bacterium]